MEDRPIHESAVLGGQVFSLEHAFQNRPDLQAFAHAYLTDSALLQAASNPENPRHQEVINQLRRIGGTMAEAMMEYFPAVVCGERPTVALADLRSLPMAQHFCAIPGLAVFPYSLERDSIVCEPNLDVFQNVLLIRDIMFDGIDEQKVISQLSGHDVSVIAGSANLDAERELTVYTAQPFRALNIWGRAALPNAPTPQLPDRGNRPAQQEFFS